MKKTLIIFSFIVLNITAIKAQNWLLAGNSISSTNFLGSTNAQPLVFKVNNQRSGLIDYDNSKSNTAFGYQALFSNTSGWYNSANGYWSLFSNTTGYLNTASGQRSLYSNTTGHENCAFGTSALLNTNAFGNTAIGYEALRYNTTGNSNTAIGWAAGTSSTNLSNSTAIGSNTNFTASNQVRVGNVSVTSIGGYVGWTNFSDSRIKKNIKQNIPGLSFINKLQPITYNLDLEALDKIIQRPEIKDKDGKVKQLSQDELNARKQKEQIVYTGFIAQDVEKAAKELNYDFSGVDAAKNDKDLYGLRYSDFVVPLVKAVQELSQQNDELKNQIAFQQKQINELKSMILTSNQNFNHSTTIGYTLPQKFSNAQIIITDKTGKILKAINVSGIGKSSLNIDTSTLASGAYSYSLLVDGKIIGSKQMILAK